METKAPKPRRRPRTFDVAEGVAIAQRLFEAQGYRAVSGVPVNAILTPGRPVAEALGEVLEDAVHAMPLVDRLASVDLAATGDRHDGRETSRRHQRPVAVLTQTQRNLRAP